MNTCNTKKSATGKSQPERFVQDEPTDPAAFNYLLHQNSAKILTSPNSQIESITLAPVVPTYPPKATEISKETDPIMMLQVSGPIMKILRDIDDLL
jgi:hypothetical protein